MLLSNCCYATLADEPYTSITGVTTGRCGDCKEHCGVINQIEVTFIKSEYPLGTTDGIDYTIVVRA